MTSYSRLRVAVIALLAVSVMTLTTRAWAKERPHSSRGTAQFVSPTDFVGEGNATHLGRYKEVGSAEFSPTPDPAILQIDAWSIYTAADGDYLFATITGHLNAVTGVITATVTYVGGTGRFEDADGSAALKGQIQPDGTIAVAVRGTIDY